MWDSYEYNFGNGVCNIPFNCEQLDYDYGDCCLKSCFENTVSVEEQTEGAISFECNVSNDWETTCIDTGSSNMPNLQEIILLVTS